MAPVKSINNYGSISDRYNSAPLLRKLFGYFLIIIFLASACAPKPTLPPRPPIPSPPPVTPAPPPPPEKVEIETGDELFARSEKLLAEKSYDQALQGYAEYLSRFPEGSDADKALIKSARIHIVLGDYSLARKAYTRLLEQYPASPEIPDARIEILLAYLKEGLYEELISKASALDDTTLSDIHYIRKYLLIGDAHLALDSPVDAIRFYSKAFRKAPESEREKIIIRFKNAIPRIDSAGIVYLLALMDDKPPAGYLMYQLGMNKVAEEKYDAAVVILTSFLDKFPEHEWAQETRDLVAEIETRFVYDRFAIGCLLPLSGRYKTYGYRALKAVELALVQFAGRKGNPDIKIIVKDTGGDPDRTAQAVDALAQEKVAAIIGPLIQVETAAIQAQARELPIITLTQKDQITEIGDYVFRNFFTPKMQVKSLVSYAVKELGLSRFAILYPDERYGSTFMNLLWDEVIAHDGIVVGVESYDPKQTDFAGPIKKLVGLFYEVPEDLKDPIDLIAESLVIPTDASEEEKEKPGRKDDDEEPQAIVDFDAVFIPDSPKKAGLIIPQLAFYDISDVYLLGTNLWNSNDLIEMAQQYVQAAVIPAGFFPGSRSEHVRNFMNAFEDDFMDTPGFIEAVSFDTATILLQFTNRPDIRTRKGLAMALKNLKNYKGVTGLTSFTESGDVDKDLYILRIRGNKFVEPKRNSGGMKFNSVSVRSDQ